MQPNYAPQRATHRRTESAVLSATKELIAERGLSSISMIEIAERSQVSRATLYNHYRDKDAVVSALIDSEVDRLVEIASSGTPADCLEKLAIAISTDVALAAMRTFDPQALSTLLIHGEDPRYLRLAQAVHALTKRPEATGIAMRWLIAQALQPLTVEQAHAQAAALTEATLF